MNDASKKPRILITTATSYRKEGLLRNDSTGGLNYAQAIIQAGGLPFFVGNVTPELANDYMQQADGLLLAGGADIDPMYFQQTPHPELGTVDESRDRFELALYQAAKTQRKPVLGICRGIQVINVAEGGSLHQHLPALESVMQHSQRNIDGSLFHEVMLEADSLLGRAYGRERIRTNSYHHQAVDALGDGLRVVGRTADGVIEALEGTKEHFVLATQWHPEMSYARYPQELVVFKVFIDAITRQQSSFKTVPA